MEETNFYAYMYAQATTFAFDELAEVVDLTEPESIQRAFVSYLSDYKPPLDVKDALLDEKFYVSEGEGKLGDETFIRYDMLIPGIEEKIDTDAFKSYFEEFLEKIGAERVGNNGYEVDISTSDNERGGVDLDIYIAIFGKQIKKPIKAESLKEEMK